MDEKIYRLNATEEEIERLMREDPNREVITNTLTIRLEEGIEYYASTGYAVIERNGEKIYDKGWFNDDNSYDWWSEEAFLRVLEALHDFGGDSFKEALLTYVKRVNG
jgi:hypothetical protein